MLKLSSATRYDLVNITYSMFLTLVRHAADSDHLKMTRQPVEALEAAEVADQECLGLADLLLIATSHS